MATPWGLVNSPRLRPRLPTFNTKSSSIGLFLEQALPINDLKQILLHFAYILFAYCKAKVKICK